MYQLRILVLSFMLAFTSHIWAQPKTVAIKKETKNFILDVKYPQGFNKGQIDQAVKAFITKVKNAQDMSDSDPLTANLPGKNSLYIDYKIAFQNDHAVSLLFNISTYSRGAAHPNNTVKTMNFIDGKQIGLSNLFKPNTNYLTEIANYCRTKLLKMENADEKWVNEGTQAINKNYKNWNFNDQGLAIIFDTYQVAAYVYGPQTIIIPQSSLATSLRLDIQKAVWGNA
ncbi:endo-1,4-beta-xylanase [Legionella beliardensis]|uniref:Endo-1,4-beta-xylanase n=1 Tax=Legionella beliardensis TaxID=91822 RepID=A0A378I4E0_9GAMM|nr:DUF3298 and DUF4163 domain-containing protein [Legionella beliardensis]STX29551.1 endo-1,4-beta-xylanase [Legionella beliardensis]